MVMYLSQVLVGGKERLCRWQRKLLVVENEASPFARCVWVVDEIEYTPHILRKIIEHPS